MNREYVFEAAPLAVLELTLQRVLGACELNCLTVETVPEDELLERIECAPAANRWEQTMGANLELF